MSNVFVVVAMVSMGIGLIIETVQKKPSKDYTVSLYVDGKCVRIQYLNEGSDGDQTKWIYGYKIEGGSMVKLCIDYEGEGYESR